MKYEKVAITATFLFFLDNFFVFGIIKPDKYIKINSLF